MTSDFTSTIDPGQLRCVAKARILYADTDKMGIVYHGAYFPYLELARVELLRASDLPYTVMEAEGLALPLVELGVRFLSPGMYDDHISLHVGLSRVTPVRVNFQYRIVVEPGDRVGLDAPIELLQAETRHCCVRRDTKRPERLPARMLERLRATQQAARSVAD